MSNHCDHIHDEEIVIMSKYHTFFSHIKNIQVGLDLYKKFLALENELMIARGFEPNKSFSEYDQFCLNFLKEHYDSCPYHYNEFEGMSGEEFTGY